MRAGLSVLSCAFELAERRRALVLLEARPFVGGQTFLAGQDGMPVASGLHF